MMTPSAGTKKKAELLVPRNEDAALVRIEHHGLTATGRDADWIRLVVEALAKGNAKVVQKTHYVLATAECNGVGGSIGEFVVQKRPHGAFKIVPHQNTPTTMIETCARMLARGGSIKLEEKHGKVVARGTFNGKADVEGLKGVDAKMPLKLADSTGEKPAKTNSRTHAGHAVTAESDVAPVVSAEQAREILQQKVLMTFLESGTKVRMVGGKVDCETMAKTVIAGSPTLSAAKGAKHQIEGNITRAFSEKAVGTGAADAHGVRTRDDISGRTFSAFGDDLSAVQRSTHAQCKPGTIVTVVIGSRIISSGSRIQK